MKIQQEIFVNALEFAKFANIFFREQFPLHGIIRVSNFFFFFNCYLIREATSARAVFQLRPALNIQYTHAYNNYYR